MMRAASFAAIALSAPAWALDDEKKDKDAKSTSESDKKTGEAKETSGAPTRTRVRIIRRAEDPDRYADPMLSSPIAPTLLGGAPAPALGSVEAGAPLAPPSGPPAGMRTDADEPGDLVIPNEWSGGERGAWHVQVGAFASPLAARRRLAEASDAIGGGAASLDMRVALADLSGAALYRARFAGLSEPRAIALCDRLKAAGVDCFAAPGDLSR